MRKMVRKRGSVLVLVAAVLALLAVLATVYVTMARTSVQSARMTSSAMNMDMARDSVMSQVRTVLFTATTDSQGVIGGLTSRHGTVIGKTSRYYDYPESGATPGQTDGNAECPDEGWLVRSAYPTSPTDFSRIAAYGFNPATNDASIPVTSATLNAVGDGDATGADAGAYLLSYSAGTGERYRFGVRIVDLSGMANLNSGAAQTVSDPQGKYLTSYALGNFPGLEQSRRGTYAAGFSLEDWQKQMLSIERTPAAGVALFDVSDELELRSFGNRGTGYVCRPAYGMTILAAGSAARGDYTTYSFSRDLRLRPDPVLPAPVATTAPATAPAGPPSPPYTLTPADGNFPVDCGMYVWPLLPEKVWVNPTLDVSGDVGKSDAIFYHARAATNIATAMEQAGFSTDEARGFAANYLSYRWNGAVKDASGAYTFPAGPSFVDDQGICVRVADTSGVVTVRDFGGGSDLRSVVPGEDVSKHAPHVYLGFLPQPFVNEVAGVLQTDKGTGVVTVSDVAVELYNPYPIALSLKGFKLKAGGAEIDLSAVTIPAGGFVTVVQQGGGVLAGKVNGGMTVVNAGLSLNPAGGTIGLTRAYIPRGKTSMDASADGTVDAYQYDTLVAAAGISADAKGIYFLRRSNEATSPHWAAAVQASGASTRYVDGTRGTLTLGAANADDGVAGVALWDRFSRQLAGQSTEPTVQQADGFANFGEFNRVLRVCNQCAVAGGSGPAFVESTVAGQLGKVVDNAKTPPSEVASTDFPVDAQVHFDFKGSPYFFLNAATRSSSALKPGDGRAVKLLDYLAMVDRVPDRTIDVGSGAVSIDKMRVPGRINVNTASRNVLVGLPNVTSAMADAIVAYRDRTGAFADTSEYPGKGIRTLAELLVPLQLTGTSTLEDRDKAWASVINMCTTRSDTFVVYGYLEVIRASPVVAHDNGSDWYDVVGTSDDPRSVTAKNIRLARFRWIAVMDRSWCNYGRGAVQFSLPRVVAMENLSP